MCVKNKLESPRYVIEKMSAVRMRKKVVCDSIVRAQQESLHALHRLFVVANRGGVAHEPAAAPQRVRRPEMTTGGGMSTSR
jgi:hypothetical protein